MAIAVVPGEFVPVIAARRDQAIQHFGQIVLEARLEFDRANRPGTADAEYLDDACLDTRARDDLHDLTGDIGHVPVPCCLEGELFLVVHGRCRSIESSHCMRLIGRFELLDLFMAYLPTIILSTARPFGNAPAARQMKTF
jgi:hypothetical protein